MTRLFSALAALILLASPLARAEVNYISDDLFTYIHSGPGSQYRILGSVNAGSEISLIKHDDASKYSQIIDNKGRTGWVETRFITATPSLKMQMPALEAELISVKTALETSRNDAKANNQGLINSLAQRNGRVKELEQYTGELNQQLSESQAEIRELRARIDTQKDDLLMRYFAYGAMVAGGGLFVGLVLPMLLPRRRKSGGWA